MLIFHLYCRGCTTTVWIPRVPRAGGYKWGRISLPQPGSGGRGGSSESRGALDHNGAPDGSALHAALNPPQHSVRVGTAHGQTRVVRGPLVLTHHRIIQIMTRSTDCVKLRSRLNTHQELHFSHVITYVILIM